MNHRGKIGILGVSLILIFTVSCLPPGDDLPMNPKTLFLFESQFLLDVSAVAIKGSIDFESEYGRESGNFSAIISGVDSLFFLVEGPFKTDLFTLITYGDSAFAKSRDMKSWEILKSGGIEIPGYDLGDLAPSDLGVYLLPQYYLETTEDIGRKTTLISRSDNILYFATTVGDSRSFTLQRESSPITAVYKKAIRFENGRYPSELVVVNESEDWRISMKIDKIRIEPKISPKIWQITP
ncbi:MAG: hypothetical protein V3W18_04505 [candidate division Zixibacteria bacterium]